MIKWIGQHIIDLIARFRSDVYLESISSGTIASGGNLGLDSNNKIVKDSGVGATDLHGAGVDGSANQLLTDDGDGTVTSESTLTYDAETLTIGVDDNGGAAIIRKPHSDEAGGKLEIKGGNSGGTDKTGGDLNLWSGAGTGAAYGGDINFYAGNVDGSSGSTNNLPLLMATIDGSAGDFLMSGIDLIRGKTDSDFEIQSDGSMAFTLDRDNDETSQKFSWNNYTTEIGFLDEDGNLTIRGTITAQSAGGATKYPAKGSAGNFMVDDAGVLSTRTSANVMADLSGAAGADFAMNSQKITGVTDPTSAQDAATKAYVDVTRTLAQGGTGQTSAADAFTALKQAASASATGVVELATTAEADTGTDTARAVTPAGLKSHVDARYSYQYIPLSMNLTGSGAGNWEYASGNGIGNHLYNQDGGSDGTTASNTDGSASTISIHQYQVSGGIIVPYDCVLVGFYGHTRSADNSARALGLFTGTQNWNTLTPVTAYLRAHAQNDTSAVGGDDNYSVRPFEHSVLDVNLSMDAGQCIWMCGRDPAGAGGGMIASVTIVLKTLMP